MADILDKLWTHHAEQISDAMVGKKLCKEAYIEIEHLRDLLDNIYEDIRRSRR